jgi:hypothetical protein
LNDYVQSLQVAVSEPFKVVEETEYNADTRARVKELGT